ncbi:MAG: hypothetical protein KGI04_01725 [Candidatus Micrarchaeota archaeon]|nr:hypothetical protein [Candidatus Micrarchaeota archaeon]
MTGETRFRSRIAGDALRSHVTDAFALIGANGDARYKKTVFTTEYVFAYDFTNIKSEFLVKMVSDKVLEVATKHGYLAKEAKETMDNRGRAIKEIMLGDEDQRSAVIFVMEKDQESLRDTAFFSRVVMYGGMKRAFAFGNGGAAFVDKVEKLMSEVLDELFSVRAASDIYALQRDSNPGYIQ